NFISVANASYMEVWDMGFHCTTGDIFTVGGGHNSNISAATINTLTSMLSLATFQPSNNAIHQDFCSICIDDLGNIFTVYSSIIAGLNNQVCRLNSTFNGIAWMTYCGQNTMS